MERQQESLQKGQNFAHKEFNKTQSFKYHQKNSLNNIQKQESRIPLSQDQMYMTHIRSSIQSEDQIIEYFRFWAKKSTIHTECYKRLSPEERKALKLKMSICEKYSQLYVHPIISAWYYQKILNMSKAVPKEPLTILPSQQFNKILAELHTTHKENREQLFPRKKTVEVPPKTNPKKNFFSSVVELISTVFQKDRVQLKYISPQKRKLKEPDSDTQ